MLHKNFNTEQHIYSQCTIGKIHTVDVILYVSDHAQATRTDVMYSLAQRGLGHTVAAAIQQLQRNMRFALTSCHHDANFDSRES